MVTFKNDFAFGTNTASVEIDFESLPQAAKEFVIAYGIRQYLNDGAAVAKDELPTEEERNKLKLDRVLERVTKLKDGTMSVRGGTRTTDPIAKVKRDLAIEILKPIYKQNSVAFPKGQELSDKIAAFWERNGGNAKVAAELDKRIKALTKLDAGELDIAL